MNRISHLAAVATFLSLAAVSQAANITFNDLTETISVTTDGSAGNIRYASDNDPANEFLHFFFTSTQTNTTFTASYTARILERGGGDSDWFTVLATSGSNQLEVRFWSDPAPFPTNLPPDLTFTEDGTKQFLVSYFGGSPTAIDTFYVLSDVADAPEPATVLLMGSAFAALAGFGRLRRARAQHRIFEEV